MKHYKVLIITSLVFAFGLIAGCFIENFVSSKSVSNAAIAKDITLSASVKAKVESKEVQKPSVILFHSQKCSSCTKIRPVWLTLRKEYKKDFNFYEIDVDEQRNIPICLEFLVTTIPTIYIEDVPFRNRAYINPAMYGYLPRFEEELSRYLDVRKILKNGVKSEN